MILIIASITVHRLSEHFSTVSVTVSSKCIISLTSVTMLIVFTYLTIFSHISPNSE